MANSIELNCSIYGKSYWVTSETVKIYVRAMGPVYTIEAYIPLNHLWGG